MNPLFSIITVSLNAGDGLLQTIDSVLMQDFRDFEIIIKDGYSKDGSFERVPNNEKIKKIQKIDSGIYDAMNQALEYAKGKYILFLNAADYFYDNSVLLSFYNAIKTEKYPDLIYCDYMTTRLGVYIQSPLKLTKRFLFRTMLCHQVCMINSECFKSLKGFNTNYKVVADYDFLLRLFFKPNFRYKHIQKLGMISTSGGFSFQNKSLAERESILVRRQHFSGSYYLYNLFLLLTLPGLRKKIAAGNGLMAKLYKIIVNVLNRFI